MNDSHEKTFKWLWRELCKEGWKAQKSSGLAKGHRYVKPGLNGHLGECR
ncbi:hypothetical protein PHMEG_00025238 [Phytophthora megakarya]|uniref:Uncharacterized protein n=1 Tax=Phytophthora megakarya TaxID=4795 RepID=A0A225VCI8_9STRA|nr:hypothetical protein PHMEG_00025238 [Phytophthora megakarya]